MRKLYEKNQPIKNFVIPLSWCRAVCVFMFFFNQRKEQIHKRVIVVGWGQNWNQIWQRPSHSESHLVWKLSETPKNAETVHFGSKDAEPGGSKQKKENPFKKQKGNCKTKVKNNIENKKLGFLTMKSSFLLAHMNFLEHLFGNDPLILNIVTFQYVL